MVKKIKFSKKRKNNKNMPQKSNIDTKKYVSVNKEDLYEYIVKSGF